MKTNNNKSVLWLLWLVPRTIDAVVLERTVLLTAYILIMIWNSFNKSTICIDAYENDINMTGHVAPCTECLVMIVVGNVSPLFSLNSYNVVFLSRNETRFKLNGAVAPLACVCVLLYIMQFM